jgi:hypothetical protein
LRITRYPSLTDPQFLGCVAAFVDSLTGELNAASLALRRLEGQPKGSAFAYEMTLDTHRYGALIVLDRWGTLIHAFGPQVESPKGRGVVDEGPAHIQAGENILGRVNQLIDAAPVYTNDLVEACVLAFHSVQATFQEEQQIVAQQALLGPMLPEGYKEARRIFLEDLAAR